MLPSSHSQSHGRRAFLGSLVTALACIQLPVCAAETESIANARDVYKQYIEVRKLIGEEKATWRTEQVALADMIGVLEAEAAQLEEAMKSLRSSASTADQKRAELNTSLESARATSTAFDATIADFEKRIKGLVVRLPDPLRRELQPLLSRLPEDPEQTRLGYSQRLQSVVGILAQTDKFNSDMKYVSEVKTIEGESLEVQTIYLGLATALFSDATGRYAGYGYPAEDGWKWTTAKGPDAAAVAQAIDIYLSRKSPAFVAVPLHVD